MFGLSLTCVFNVEAADTVSAASNCASNQVACYFRIL